MDMNGDVTIAKTAYKMGLPYCGFSPSVFGIKIFWSIKTTVFFFVVLVGTVSTCGFSVFPSDSNVRFE